MTCPDFYTIRKSIYPSFLRRRTVCGGDPFYVNFGRKMIDGDVPLNVNVALSKPLGPLDAAAVLS